MAVLTQENRLNSEIVLVLDRSGSMTSTKDSAEKGLREFVKGQREVEGEATLAFYRFDDYPERIFVKDLKAVEEPELKLEPRGMTALFDAIGTAIDETEQRLKNPPAGKPKRLIALKGKKPKEDETTVIFLIVTDGGENASKTYTQAQIFDRISDLRKEGWDFIFVGANQDAIQSAKSIGIDAGQSLSYASHAMGDTYNVVNQAVAFTRTSGQAYCMSDDDRNKAMAKPKKKSIISKS